MERISENILYMGLEDELEGFIQKNGEAHDSGWQVMNYKLKISNQSVQAAEEGLKYGGALDFDSYKEILSFFIENLEKTVTFSFDMADLGEKEFISLSID